MNTVYTHYYNNGIGRFDSEVFKPIKNLEVCYLNKPDNDTGFWGSPLMSEYGWKQWCKDNMPEWIDGASCFCFTLSDDANILSLNSKSDLEEFINQNPEMIIHNGLSEDLSFACSVVFDFEKMLNSGIDAIEVKIKDLYYGIMYGWDCDSILIMNPAVVINV